MNPETNYIHAAKFFQITTIGVCQCGIVSPVYFNVYIDRLIELLNQSGIGCKINGQGINNVMYEADSCLMSHSPADFNSH